MNGIERLVLAEIAIGIEPPTAMAIAERLSLDPLQVDRVLKALVLSGEVAVNASVAGGWRYRLRERAVGRRMVRAS